MICNTTIEFCRNTYGHFFSTAQLEEVLDPYLADTNIGLPYWDWTKDSSVPDVWENIRSPIKAPYYRGYNWQNWKGWIDMLSVCHNPDPLSGPQTHALRIRKKEFEGIKRKHVIARGGQQHLKHDDPFSHLLNDNIKDALQDKSYEDFTREINAGHAAIHNTLKCTTAFATTTAYGMRYMI